MMENSFVALDFETANYKRTSICSVGMVKVVANEIVETFYTLVNPNDFFAARNIEVHGIQAKHVQHSPNFAYVYPYMMQFIGDLPVVAHNAAFDMSVLARQHPSRKPHHTTNDLLLFISTRKKDGICTSPWLKTYDVSFQS